MMFLVRAVLFLKIDLLYRKIKTILDLALWERTKKKLNMSVNYVQQGHNYPLIVASNGIFNFSIDRTSHLKSDTFIECSGGVFIGKYFHTGRNLTIFSSNHNYNRPSSLPYDSLDIHKPVVIKDFVWCGANVTILPGVCIEEGVVIGAGSVICSLLSILGNYEVNLLEDINLSSILIGYAGALNSLINAIASKKENKFN